MKSPTPKVTATCASEASELDSTAINARIAVVSARTDIPEQKRELALKQLRTAASRLDAAGATRKAAQDYAATLKSAPKTIAALNAESAISTADAAPNAAASGISHPDRTNPHRHVPAAA